MLCTLVSFFHGRNDGQKGIGLLMIILIAFLPSYFALNNDIDPFKMKGDVDKVQALISKIDTTQLSSAEKESYYKVMKATTGLEVILTDSSKGTE